MSNGHNTAREAVTGDIVVDSRNPYRVVIGTVTDSRGGMFTNDAVEVFWHHLGYTNWEDAWSLQVVETSGRTVTVSSPSLD